jgi:hypothetical protein
MPTNSFGAAMRELARQIRLQFADSPALYLSWTWERQRGPGSEPYSIVFLESSYFANSGGTRHQCVGLATLVRSHRPGN